jgi:hypothetical protein
LFLCCGALIWISKTLMRPTGNWLRRSRFGGRNPKALHDEMFALSKLCAVREKILQQFQFEAMRFWVSVAVAQFKRRCVASDQIPVTVLIPMIQGCAGLMNTDTISPDGI